MILVKNLNFIKKIKPMSYIKFFMGIVIGVLIANITLYYASSILVDADDVRFKNTDTVISSSNVQDAIDELSGICP